jgi:hypothetical protein
MLTNKEKEDLWVEWSKASRCLLSIAVVEGKALAMQLHSYVFVPLRGLLLIYKLHKAQANVIVEVYNQIGMPFRGLVYSQSM